MKNHHLTSKLAAAESKVKEQARLFEQLKEVNSKNYKESCEWELNCNDLKAKLAAQEQELEAYKKAKAENDERFQLEIGILKRKLEKCKNQRNLILTGHEDWSGRVRHTDVDYLDAAIEAIKE